jgi:hypothetical protein
VQVIETMHKDQGEYYRIVVSGHLDDHLKVWFNGMDIQNLPQGTAVITGYIVDQAYLHGLLKQIQELGLPLISLNRS